MALKDIDKKANNKGKGVAELWTFVKFIFVSLLAMIVQFVLLNTLKYIPAIQALYHNGQDFNWWVFTSTAAAGGLGYFIVNNVANIAAQIVSFFFNREKTFNSSANIAVTLPTYIVFTIALIAFSAWLNPTLKNLMVAHNWGDDLAANAATMVCSALQFFLYFPVDKILFHKKKEEPAEAAEPAADDAAAE